MTEENKKIYMNLVVGALNELSDKDYQHRVWLGHSKTEMASLTEALAALYDDSGLDYALEQNCSTFSEDIDNDLRELLKKLMHFQRLELEIGTAPLLELKEWKYVQSLAQSILSRIRAGGFS